MPSQYCTFSGAGGVANVDVVVSVFREYKSDVVVGVHRFPAKRYCLFLIAWLR